MHPHRGLHVIIYRHFAAYGNFITWIQLRSRSFTVLWVCYAQAYQKWTNVKLAEKVLRSVNKEQASKMDT